MLVLSMSRTDACTLKPSRVAINGKCLAVPVNRLVFSSFFFLPFNGNANYLERTTVQLQVRHAPVRQCCP